MRNKKNLIRKFLSTFGKVCILVSFLSLAYLIFFNYQLGDKEVRCGFDWPFPVYIILLGAFILAIFSFTMEALIGFSLKRSK